MNEILGYISQIFAWYKGNGFSDLILHSQALFLGLAGLAAIFPGDHPDKEFQAIADFVKKYSKK
jgi:hypothetical protein